MKKTIAIHINKTVFQIDEDAYQKLEKYLDNIKQHYGPGEEGREILADMESGVAEKFNELLTDKNQSLSTDDVDKIIKIMGTVEEIDDQKPDEQSTTKEIPETDTSENSTPKRLYRNPDDVVIAGICSGLAAYFGVDPVYVRILFLVAIFFNGLGLLVYLILWLAMPLAKTSAQKLEMQGEPVNLKKIEEAVKEKTKIIREEGEAALKKINPENSTVKKIVSFPVTIVGNIFYVIKKIFLTITPIISALIGIAFSLAGICAIIGITIALFVVFFNIGTSYIVTDIPLETTTSSLLYYPGILSIYLIVFIPIILFFILGITLIRRKNTFNSIFTGLLLGIWAISVAIGISFAADVAPRIKQEIQNQQNQTGIEKSYDYQNWKKIYISGNIEATIKKGNTFKITMNGQEKNLNQLNFIIEDEQLQVEQAQNTDDKICIFCHNPKIIAEIIVPELTSVVSINGSQIKIDGFDQDIYLSLGESGQIELKTLGQNVTCKLSGVSSHLTLTGTVKEINCEMDGHAGLSVEKIKAEKIILSQNVFSYAELSGETRELIADLYNGANLDARRLTAEETTVNTYDYSSAEIKESAKNTGEQNQEIE